MARRTLTLAVLALAFMAGHALAADKEASPLAKMDGKEIYKNVCKQCHGAEAEAGEYTPMSLIQDQWTEFFDEILVETHDELSCPQDENVKLLEVLDQDALKKVREFCVDHAADSEQPMTCG